MTDPPQILIDPKAIDRFVGAQRRTVRSMIVFIVVVTLIVAGFFVWVTARSYQSQNRQECIARTEAVGLGDLVNALKGTPATPGRNAKLTRAANELAKLRDVGATCG